MHESLENFIEDQFNSTITSINSISGGDISSAYHLCLDNSQEYIVKCHSNTTAHEMFKKELRGLDLISQSNSIAIPRVENIYHDHQISAIIMDFIPTKQADNKDMKRLGMELAKMHESSQTQFGLATDNFIGSLKQCNNQSRNWVTFYIEQRLQAQLNLAVKSGLLSPSEKPSVDLMSQRLNDIIEVEKPSLLHGDLWGGNYLIRNDGKPFLIDPAVYFGDKIIDIAMSQLFGGFSKDFYESYFYWTSEVQHLEERIELYQLYYLLVHLNLFGRSYYSSVKRILSKYF